MAGRCRISKYNVDSQHGAYIVSHYRGGQVGQARCHQPDSPDDIGITASQESPGPVLSGYLPRAETDEKGGT